MLYKILLLWFLVCLPSLSFADSWETQKLSHFYIHYQPVDKHITRNIASKAENIFQTITENVGYEPQRKIAVYLCPTPECFHQKQPSQVKLPEWAAGVAYPHLNRIVMRSASTAQEKGTVHPVEIFKHEVAHIVLEQALAARGGAPRWLSEGFSMYHARQWTVYGQKTIEETTLRDNFIPLHLLVSTFPSEENAARIAYAQSFSVVSFLLHDYGQPIFHKFIENLKMGMDTNTALVYSAGVNVKRLELEWQASLKKRYYWFGYLSNIGLFWFALSVGFVIIYLVKRQKTKRIQEQWEQEESEENEVDWHQIDLS